MAKSKELNFVADQEQIRCLVSNIYDLQELRIAEGNRLVSNMYRRLGIAKKEDMDSDTESKETKKFIDILTADYKRIADAVAENNKTVASQINAFNSNKKDSLKAIYHETDYKLVESYVLLVKSEEEQTKVLDKYVKTHPMWSAFFEKIRGCGTLMSAVCLAYLNPYKARHSSSFVCYCGLDTVQDEDADGNLLYLTEQKYNGVRKGRKVRQKFKFVNEDGIEHDGKVIDAHENDESGVPIFYDIRENRLYKEFQYVDVPDELGEMQSQGVFEDIETGEEYIGNVIRSEHGRRMGDTEMREYIDKNGEVKLKRSITYQPFLKTKLMGVLSSRLLMAKDPVYSQIYYDYRARLDRRRACKDYSAGRKNAMALRYMIKCFLRNMWTTWRVLEGLPVDEPYEVAKLGNTPHKYNAYQCYEAQEDKKGISFEEYLDKIMVDEDDSQENEDDED